MAIVEYIYGLNVTALTITPRQFFELCRNTVCCRWSEERNTVITVITYTNTKIFLTEIFTQTDRIKSGLQIFRTYTPSKACCIFQSFGICMTTALLLTRPAQNKMLTLSFLQSKQPSEKRRSPQSCSSTVTKAFNTHPISIIA